MKKYILRKYIAIAALCFSSQSFGVGYVLRNPFSFNAVAHFVTLSDGWGILSLFLEQQAFSYFVQGTSIPTVFFPSHIALVIEGQTYFAEVLDYFSP